MQLLLGLQVLVTAVSALVIRAPAVAEELKKLVTSSPVSIEVRARWSDYNLPLPSVVVSVTSEADVAAVVKYCTKAGIPFLAQNGGNGWASEFNLGSNGVLINLSGLNQVTISRDKKSATIGGGAIINETIAAADAAGVLVQTGNCNCVGTLGALLGGGYGNIMGEHGFAVDNVISMQVVTASGKLLTVSSTSNPELFWALRGAGPNFGIVTSATVKAFPATTEDRSAWLMSLTFDPSKITQVAQTIQDLPLRPEQVVYLVLTNSGPPTNAPMVLVTGFLRKGNDISGRAAFAPLYALGPSTNSSSVAPYTGWNVGNDGFCARGGQKPAFSTTINKMNAETWPQLWDIYTEFQKKPTAEGSTILIERYNLTKAQSVAVGSSAMQEALRRDAFAQALVLPWYTDKALDADALAFGAKVRDIWSYTAKATDNPTYANFARGDESLQGIFGSSLPKLKTLKKKWDPSGVFNQWFAIK